MIQVGELYFRREPRRSGKSFTRSTYAKVLGVTDTGVKVLQNDLMGTIPKDIFTKRYVKVGG